VAYRYFATERASSSSATRPATSSTRATWSRPPRSADAAVVLVDATKLDWQNPS
jgi:sulfate adenylyltransferase subunit 1